MKDSANRPWQNNANPKTGANSVDDGATNTTSIITELGSTTDYAAGFCHSIQATPSENMDSGWYLPAICELGYNLYGDSIVCGGAAGNDMMNLSGILKSNGFTPPLGAYWSSTESVAGSTAYIQSFNAGGPSQDTRDESAGMNVRCIHSFSPN